MHYVNQIQKSIPDKLRDQKRFLLWKKDAKRGKIPLGAMLTAIDPTDSNKCLNFNTACRIAYKHHFDGINRGIGIANFGDMVFIDFDKVFDESGNLAPYVQEIINQVNSYTEISPSGRGIHILAQGSFDLPAVKTDQIEIYFKNRYFTLTGNIYRNHAEVNAVSESQINDLLERFRPQGKNNSLVAVKSSADTEEFSELDIDVIINDLKADPEAAKLFSGDISKYNNDHSDADLVLCSHIIHYAKSNNVNLIDAVFRRSGLLRGKWEQREKYRIKTIERALRRIEIKKLDFEPSETWAADIFTRLNAENVRYNHTSGEWLIWNGNIWEPDKTNKIINLARCVSHYIKTELIKNEVDSEKLKKFLSTTIKFSEVSKIRNFLTLAASNPEIAITQESINKNPYLIVCKNGTFDAKTMQFRESKREDLITKSINAEYKPDSDCPEFKDFINFISCGNTDLVRHFQQFFGLCLTGVQVPKLFCWIGNGKNGKSVTYNILYRLLGDYAQRVPSGVIDDRNFQGNGASPELASLAGKRLASCSELSLGLKLNESLIKDLTGGDIINARYLYQNSFTYEPEFKFLIIGNYKPSIRGQDLGIWRRICVIPFLNTVTPEQEIPAEILINRFVAEFPGVLNWALAGLKDYMQHGLYTPDIVEKSTTEYKQSQDILKEFFDKHCLIYPGEKCEAKKLFEKYQNEGGTVSKNTFFQMMRERGFEIKTGSRNKLFIYDIDIFELDPVNLL